MRQQARSWKSLQLFAAIKGVVSHESTHPPSPGVGPKPLATFCCRGLQTSKRASFKVSRGLTVYPLAIASGSRTNGWTESVRPRFRRNNAFTRANSATIDNQEHQCAKKGQNSRPGGAAVRRMVCPEKAFSTDPTLRCPTKLDSASTAGVKRTRLMHMSLQRTWLAGHQASDAICCDKAYGIPARAAPLAKHNNVRWQDLGNCAASWESMVRYRPLDQFVNSAELRVAARL